MIKIIKTVDIKILGNCSYVVAFDLFLIIIEYKLYCGGQYKTSILFSSFKNRIKAKYYLDKFEEDKISKLNYAPLIQNYYEILKLDLITYY